MMQHQQSTYIRHTLLTLHRVTYSQGVVIAYFPQSRSNTSITPCHSLHQRLLRLSGHPNSFVRVTSPPLLLVHQFSLFIQLHLPFLPLIKLSLTLTQQIFDFVWVDYHNTFQAKIRLMLSGFKKVDNYRVQYLTDRIFLRFGFVCIISRCLQLLINN